MFESLRAFLPFGSGLKNNKPLEAKVEQQKCPKTEKIEILQNMYLLFLSN